MGKNESLIVTLLKNFHMFQLLLLFAWFSKYNWINVVSRLLNCVKLYDFFGFHTAFVLTHSLLFSSFPIKILSKACNKLKTSLDGIFGEQQQRKCMHNSATSVSENIP